MYFGLFIPHASCDQSSPPSIFLRGPNSIVVADQNIHDRGGHKNFRYINTTVRTGEFTRKDLIPPDCFLSAGILVPFLLRADTSPRH